MVDSHWSNLRSVMCDHGGNGQASYLPVSQLSDVASHSPLSLSSLSPLCLPSPSPLCAAASLKSGGGPSCGTT